MLILFKKNIVGTEDDYKLFISYYLLLNCVKCNYYFKNNNHNLYSHFRYLYTYFTRTINIIIIIIIEYYNNYNYYTMKL